MDPSKDAPRTNLVPASEEPYPEYALDFEGELVGDPIVVRGPHSFMLPPVAPGLNIKVVIAHKDHDPGVPHLGIELRREKPKL